MAHQEQDKIDSSPILPNTHTHTSQPSRHLQGNDNPALVSSSSKSKINASLSSTNQPTAEETSGKQVMGITSWMIGTYMKIANLNQRKQKGCQKPDGDVCNLDGTLKDASEMEWPDSPSATATVALWSPPTKQNIDELSDEENDLPMLTKFLRVCIVVHGLNCALLILNQAENSVDQIASSCVSRHSSSNANNMDVDTKESNTKDEEAQKYRKALKNEGVWVKASLTHCCQHLFTEKKLQ